MQKYPIITVVIPLHNHANWITEAVMSVVNQEDYPKDKIRLVVVDDGSKDDSANVVKWLMNVDATSPANTVPETHAGFIDEIRMMVARFPQARGPAFARNFGINCGWNDTDIFAFLDSDDIYEPQKIAKSVAKFDNDIVGAVYSDYTTFNEFGPFRREYKQPFSREVLLRDCIVNCDSLVSKKAFEACGLFDENMRVCEDYDLWVRISEKFLITHIPESLIKIRIGNHSSTANVPSQVWQQNWQRIAEKARERGTI